jgi:hypothetical protein
MIENLKKLYAGAVEWVERGDLVPLIILVSIPHYISVMSAFEWWPVAVAMGILTDLGHYRTILVYLRSSVGRIAALFWMSVLTGISYAFHVGFYTLGGNIPQPWPWVIGAVPPILIFAMAYISKREGWYRRTAKGTASTANSSVRLDYRHLLPEERAALQDMTVKEIMAKYPGLSDRSARNWKARR